MDHKIITIRLPKELHKRLKISIVESETTFQELLVDLIKEYLNEKNNDDQDFSQGIRSANIPIKAQAEEEPAGKEPKKKEPPQDKPLPEGDFVKTREAAAILGVSDRTLQRKIKAGELRAEKPGKDYLIPRGEVERLKKE